jgi:hypothetical protein
MNDKSTPNQMRILLRRMREGYVMEAKEAKEEKPKKALTIRDMLKITRNLNEQVDVEDKKKAENKKNVYDQGKEEERFNNFFRDLNVNVKFIDLEVYDSLVFWGGTIDGVIQFIYTVTPDEKTSGVEFNYVEDFSPDNPENDVIIKRVESYYDLFYKYWRNNILGNEPTMEKSEEKPTTTNVE